MNTSSSFGSLQTPQLLRHGSDSARESSLAVDTHGASHRSASRQALRVDLQRRLRAQDLRPHGRSSDRIRGSETQSPDRFAAVALRDASLTSSSSPFLRSELHAVRALLASAQLELNRLTGMDEGRGIADTAHSVESPVGPTVTASLAETDRPRVQPREPRPFVPHEDRVSRLERLARGSDADSGASTRASPSARPSPSQSAPRAASTDDDALRRFDERSQSYFSALSASSRSPPSPHIRDAARRDAPATISEHPAPPARPLTRAAGVPPADAALDRYERYYQQNQRLERVHKRRAVKPTNATTTTRYPGPRPSVHLLRSIACPHSAASSPSHSMTSPHRRAPSATSPRSHDDYDERSLLEQVQHWPQQLRRRRDSFTDSDDGGEGVIHAAAAHTPRATSADLALYDPLGADAEAPVHHGIANDTNTRQANDWRGEEALRTLSDTSREADEDADDAAYMVHLRNHIANQRAEWLRVRQNARVRFESILLSPLREPLPANSRLD